MKSTKDGKSYLTDTSDTKGILRLIESIPSPNAEPFKLWLAELWKERIDEVFDPELAKEHRPYGLEENKKVAKMGGHAAKVAREDIEKNLGKTVISNKNSLSYKYINQKQLSKDINKKD